LRVTGRKEKKEWVRLALRTAHIAKNAMYATPAGPREQASGCRSVAPKEREMGLSAALAVVGILISLIFGAWGVSLMLRRRYPGQVTFVRERTIALFDAIVKNLPELAVLYRDVPVSPNVVLIRGSFVNTGTKDISPSMIEGPLTLSLPAGCKWLSASVIATSPDVKASLDVQNLNAAVLTSGLLRCKEFIRFQALADMALPEATPGRSVAGSLEERLEGSLSFEHRIEDTRPVRRVDLQASKRLKEVWRESAFWGVMLLTAVVTMGIVRAVVGPPKRFAYDLQIGNNQVARVLVHPSANGSVRAESIDGGFKATMALDEFFSRCKGRPVIVDDRFGFHLILAFFLSFTLAWLLLSTFLVRDYFANKRIRRLLALDGPGDAHGAT